MHAMDMKRILSQALVLLAAGVAGGCGDAAPSATPTAAAPSSALHDPASGARCSGKDLAITQDNARLVVDGDCGAVAISASHVALNLDGARSIRIDGSDVTVLNTRVDEVIVGGQHDVRNLTDAGGVELRGNDNRVVARKIDRARFIGDRNSVNPDNTPTLDDRGRGNTLL
jgi:Protein of unknown function (DUF3060).